MTENPIIKNENFLDIYFELIDRMDFLIEHDTTLKGTMNQRLQACRSYFAEQVNIECKGSDPSKGIMFRFADNKPLPRWLPKKQLESAICTVLYDYGLTGLIVYQGYDEGGGYINFYISGKCPIHKRVHDGQAWKWVLKVKKDKTWAGFKCWRDESFHKISCIEQLLP